MKRDMQIEAYRKDLTRLKAFEAGWKAALELAEAWNGHETMNVCGKTPTDIEWEEAFLDWIQK